MDYNFSMIQIFKIAGVVCEKKLLSVKLIYCRECQLSLTFTTSIHEHAHILNVTMVTLKIDSSILTSQHVYLFLIGHITTCKSIRTTTNLICIGYYTSIFTTIMNNSILTSFGLFNMWKDLNVTCVLK